MFHSISITKPLCMLDFVQPLQGQPCTPYTALKIAFGTLPANRHPPAGATQYTTDTRYSFFAELDNRMTENGCSPNIALLMLKPSVRQGASRHCLHHCYSLLHYYHFHDCSMMGNHFLLWKEAQTDWFHQWNKEWTEFSMYGKTGRRNTTRRLTHSSSSGFWFSRNDYPILCGRDQF